MSWKETVRVEVDVRNGDISRALQIFKRKVLECGHLDIIKGKKEYRKPSVIKRQKMQDAVKEQYKQTKKERGYIDYIKYPKGKK
jgi:ribosomal protein S21